MNDLHKEIAEKLSEVLSQGVSDDAIKSAMKKIEDILSNAQDDFEYRIREELSQNLVSFVCDMADRTVTAILEGNEDQMRRYLGCEHGHWNGRSDGDQGWGAKRRDEDWHPVIHGKLFEQGAVALRAKIVAANRELITDERVKDLEDQVRSLVAQVNKANSEKDQMWERLRAVA